MPAMRCRHVFLVLAMVGRGGFGLMAMLARLCSLLFRRMPLPGDRFPMMLRRSNLFLMLPSVGRSSLFAMFYVMRWGSGDIRAGISRKNGCCCGCDAELRPALSYTIHRVGSLLRLASGRRPVATIRQGIARV
jgi:hypothetical protein